MLGLTRNTLRLVDHRPEWLTTFQQEASELWECLGNRAIDIQHVGSTAVADLPAKPILDVAIGVSAPDGVDPVVARLSQHGYIARGDSGSEGGYLLVKESAPDVRMVHAHVVAITDRQWADYIAFRDVLRRDSNIRDRYAALKKTLAVQYGNDRRAYTSGKAAFIREVLDSLEQSR